MISTPATLASRSRFSATSWPMVEAVAPSAMNTVPSPSAKAIAARITRQRAAASTRSPVTSPIETPAIQHR